eukprot:4191377-Prymnesium_polylepis.1
MRSDGCCARECLVLCLLTICALLETQRSRRTSAVHVLFADGISGGKRAVFWVLEGSRAHGAVMNFCGLGGAE